MRMRKELIDHKQPSTGSYSLNLTNEVLLQVVSALAWGNNAGKDSSDLPGGLDDVADALVIVSHNSCLLLLCRNVTTQISQILKALDTFTDGVGLLTIDPHRSQSQTRYGDFRAMAYTHFQALRENRPQEWASFVQSLQAIQPRRPERCRFAELDLNAFDSGVF